MFRIAINNTLVKGQTLVLEGDDHHYISKVLRLKEGDLIILFNEAEEYLSSVLYQSKKTITLELLEKLDNDREPKKEVILAFGYPKGEKIDLVIQKATELGVTQIWPVITSRSLIKLDGNKVEKKLERLDRIAKEATEQSGRLMVPKIKIFQSLKKMSEEVRENDWLLIPWEAEKEKELPTKKLFECQGRIIVFIGPEGGIDQKELEVFKKYTTITLGKRILRAETACIVATTIVMYNLGELGGKTVD